MPGTDKGKVHRTPWSALNLTLQAYLRKNKDPIQLVDLLWLAETIQKGITAGIGPCSGRSKITRKSKQRIRHK